MDALAPFLGSLVSALVLGYFYSQARKEVEKGPDGAIELRNSRVYQILAYVIIGLGLAAFVWSLYSNDPDALTIGSIFFFLCCAFGWALLGSYNNERVYFNEESVIVQSWSKKSREVKWTDITKMKVNPLSGYLNIYENKKKMSIPMYIVGMKSFAQMVERKTKWTAKELKLPVR